MRRGVTKGAACAAIAALCLLAGTAGASIFRDGTATVVSGDEVVVGGVRFRFRVADAFELGQKCWTAQTEFDCGAKAKLVLEEIIGKAPIFCGGPGADLAVCLTKEKVSVPEEMIRRGWAFVRPDLALDSAETTKLCELEAQAKRLRRGVWSGYTFALPYFQRGEKGKTREQVSCGNAPEFRP
jgi:endonuclease YncB( thermonuclease family)